MLRERSEWWMDVFLVQFIRKRGRNQSVSYMRSSWRGVNKMFSHGKLMKHVYFLSWMKSCAQLMKKWVGDQQLWYMKSTWRSLVSHPESCSVFVLINISCQSNDFYNEHYSCWIHEEARRKSTTFEHGKLTATQGKHFKPLKF